MIKGELFNCDVVQVMNDMDELYRNLTEDEIIEVVNSYNERFVDENGKFDGHARFVVEELIEEILKNEPLVCTHKGCREIQIAECEFCEDHAPKDDNV